MTAVDSSEAGKKVSKSRKRNSKRRKEKKRLKGKFRVAKRLEKYRKIFEATKAARQKPASPYTFDVNLPGKFLEVSRRVVTSANTAAQPLRTSFHINPQRAMSGNCFWLNYQSVFHWKDQHMSGMSAYHSFPRMLEQSKIPPPNSQIYKNCQESRSQEADVLRDERFAKGSTAQSEYYEAEDSVVEGADDLIEEGNESDEDIVVTEEMMQFLEISMRHKAKREREKQAAKELERKTRIEQRDTIEDCEAPTEEDENEKRLREMSALYGEEAAKIHGMETALQLNFNRQLDLFDPSYWPFYPFSMQFTGVTALK